MKLIVVREKYVSEHHDWISNSNEIELAEQRRGRRLVTILFI